MNENVEVGMAEKACFFCNSYHLVSVKQKYPSHITDEVIKVLTMYKDVRRAGFN